MKATWKFNKKAVGYFFVWLIFVLLCINLSFESYGESEPHAGNIFTIASILCFVIGIGLYYKFKPEFIFVKCE